DAELAVREAFGDRQSPTLAQTRKHREQAGTISLLQFRVGQAAQHNDLAIEIPARLEIRQQAVNQPTDLSGENQARYAVSAVPLQQPLPHPDKQPMVLSNFNGGDEQDISRRKPCRRPVYGRQPIARAQLHDLDARQSPAGLRSQLDESSP